MDDQQFRDRADEALEDLNQALIAASDDHGFDVDFQSGALAVEFDEPPAKFVVSPNAPVQQIWVSALSRSFKLSWDDEAQTFLYPETRESLHTLLAKVISVHLGADVFV
ncbi:MAG: iron donor protein CyaY [Acidobacteriota bacterium]|nr:iron donor protein CyaY [Acidobacteriota bacterium]